MNHVEAKQKLNKANRALALLALAEKSVLSVAMGKISHDQHWTEGHIEGRDSHPAVREFFDKIFDAKKQLENKLKEELKETFK